MRMRLSQVLQTRLFDWARAAAPREACGTLIGRRSAGEFAVADVACGRNLAPERALDRFELDPLHVVEADAAARARGLEVVGVWHSHPLGPALPSAADRDGVGGAWPCAIVSLRGRKAMIRAWRLVNGAFVEDDVV